MKDSSTLEALVLQANQAQTKRRAITESEIMSQQTLRGGWTRATLASWGVPWIHKGWKRLLLEHGAPLIDPESDIWPDDQKKPA